jgi:hypothetical protein
MHFDAKATGCQVGDEVVQTEHHCSENGKVHHDLLQYDGLHHRPSLICASHAFAEKGDLYDGRNANSACNQLMSTAGIESLELTLSSPRAAS